MMVGIATGGWIHFGGSSSQGCRDKGNCSQDSCTSEFAFCSGTTSFLKGHLEETLNYLSYPPLDLDVELVAYCCKQTLSSI
jgi:hypothetical protein